MAFFGVQKKALAIRMNKNKIDQNFRKYNQIIKTENQKKKKDLGKKLTFIMVQQRILEKQLIAAELSCINLRLL